MLGWSIGRLGWSVGRARLGRGVTRSGRGVGLPGLCGLRVARLALVADLRHVARVAVHVVGHLLQAAVGELHVVGALGVISVAGLLVAEVIAGVFIPHGVVEVVLGLRGLVGFVGLLAEVLTWEEVVEDVFDRMEGLSGVF